MGYCQDCKFSDYQLIQCRSPKTVKFRDTYAARIPVYPSCYSKNKNNGCKDFEYELKDCEYNIKNEWKVSVLFEFFLFGFIMFGVLGLIWVFMLLLK